MKSRFKTLDDWIRFTATEHVPEELKGQEFELALGILMPVQKIFPAYRGFHHNEIASPFKSKKAQAERTLSPVPVAHLTALLHNLWADPTHWEHVREGDPSQTQAYIKKQYAMGLPNFPTNAWQAMVDNPFKRGELFVVIARQCWRLLPAWSFSDQQKIWDELSNAPILEIARQYLSGSRLDKKEFLASAQFSPRTLRALHQATKELMEDVEWCATHAGTVPPPGIRGQQGGGPSSERSFRLEELVSFLLANPDLALRSNGEVAREFLAQKDGDKKSLIDRGSEGENYKKLANDAKNLVSLRHRLPVKFHSPRGK
jgi:hypothetical protein